MKYLITLAVVAMALVGCSGNPTNEPSEAAIKDAVDAKFKAIDNDPNLTPQQKEEMKKHMSGYKPAGAADRK